MRWVPWLGMLVACSASPKINLGVEADAAAGGTGGAAGLGGRGGVGGFGGNDNALRASITEPPSPIAIEIVTLDCSGQCKDVLAIANGGHAPYTFAWSDGLDTAMRTICPHHARTLSVNVTDTAIVDGEFPYPGQTATASVTIEQLACPDAGASDAAVLDASGPDAGSDAAVSDAGMGCRGRLNIPAVDGCPIRASHACPGSANVAIDLMRPIEPGDARCFDVQIAPPVLGQTTAYLSLGRDCVPLEGQGSWGNSIPEGASIGVCFEATNERATQIILSPGFGYFDDAFQFGECDHCPTLP